VSHEAAGCPDIICLEAPGHGRSVPTVFRRRAYRFFFFSNEGEEAPHVHVQREAMIVKIWLEPPGIASTGDFAEVEIREIERIVRKERKLLLKAWHDFFQR
jgi:hypothetical protein